MLEKQYISLVALSVALGGFLMGFDASVISGVVGLIEAEFQLSKLELGWAVASLTLTSTLAMLFAGPISDRIGRIPTLKIAALLFLVSALACAFATSFNQLVIARMVGGLGVGAALIVAPMFIAEIAPAAKRGRLVSFNQLNIVVGISAAFFSNYLLLQLSQSEFASAFIAPELLWRWMLGVEAIPALLYLMALQMVPESPRWLLMMDRREQALTVLIKVNGPAEGENQAEQISAALKVESDSEVMGVKGLLDPGLRWVLLVGISVAVLQQITGINAVFFYAPMIFEQTGIGSDAALLQAVLVGLVNLVFTIIAIVTIDRVGRKPLLQLGVMGIAFFMVLLSFTFNQASYQIDADDLKQIDAIEVRQSLLSLVGKQFASEMELKSALEEVAGDTVKPFETDLVAAAIEINATLVLIGILGFVACFAVSLGPVMWVLFSELFPNYIRGIAISFVGLINSGVSFLVQLVFPWELANVGSATTFLIYGILAAIGLVVVNRIVPETKGKTLEELELELVRRQAG